MKIHEQKLLNTFQEIDQFYQKAVDRVLDNPFFRKKLTWVDRLFGINETEVDLYIIKLRMQEYNLLKEIIENYRFLSTRKKEDQERDKRIKAFVRRGKKLWKK